MKTLTCSVFPNFNYFSFNITSCEGTVYAMYWSRDIVKPVFGNLVYSCYHLLRETCQAVELPQPAELQEQSSLHSTRCEISISPRF